MPAVADSTTVYIPVRRNPLLFLFLAVRSHDNLPTNNSLSLKHLSPEVFGSSRLLPQKPYVLLRACLALNSLYWLIRSMSVFGKAHWLVSVPGSRPGVL